MTKRTKRFGMGTAVVFAVGLALLALRHLHSQAATVTQAAPTIRVYVLRPQHGGIERTLTRPASIHAFQRADLYAKVSGFLQNQVVDIGDAVKKDQILAGIFAPEIEAGVQKAQADVNKAQALVGVAQASLDEADAGVKQARAKLAQSQADLESAQAMLKLREEQLQRISSLAKMKAVEKELVDEKFQARQSAQAAKHASEDAITTARAAVDAAKARVVRAKADLANSRAQVQVDQAALAQANALAAYTHIRAPFDGIITKRSFHDGDFVRDAASGGSVPVLGVAEVQKMRVIVWVPDDDVPFIRKGDRASVTPFSMTHEPLRGQISRTAMSEDYNSRTMRVEIDVSNPNKLLTDGMYGSATIDMGKDPNALTIPSVCLVGDEAKNDERAVYVVRDGKAHQVTVRVGANDGIHAEILSGLQADDQVIRDHGPGIADGSTVEIVSGGKG